jgi:hypothetical protein
MSLKVSHIIINFNTAYTNIESTKRREMQSGGWEEQIYFVTIDLDLE